MSYVSPQRELGINDDIYAEPFPTPVHRMKEPVVVKARTNVRVSTVFYAF